MADDKSYDILDEGNELVVQLRQRYPNELRNVIPEEVVVLKIEDDPPTSKDWAAKIHLVKGAIKAMLTIYKCPAKFYIELYEADWRSWSNQRRQWVIFHELLHVPDPEASGLVNHDVEDFAVVLDKVGLNWTDPQTSLPDMINGDLVEFNKKYIERLHVAKKKKEKPEDIKLVPEKEQQ